MKDVWGRDRPRGAADRALIRGCPNGVTRRLLWAGTAEFVRGVRREVKHLSTCRKGYSVSSGERKRMMAKPVPCDTRQGLRHWCRGSGRAGADAPAASDKTVCEANRVGYRAVEGDGPVAERAWSGGSRVPSSAGLVESRVNPPRPLGKPEYTCLTDSGPVP